MKRNVAILAGCTVALAAGGILFTASRERSRPSRQSAIPATAFKTSVRKPELPPPSPPMQGRIALTDEQVHDAYAAGLLDHPVKSILKVDKPMSYGEFVWNDRGVPPGPVWIRVDLASQLMSVFRSGHEIGTAVILYGADGYPTPTGKFPILAKFKDHESATYDNAPMPYTLRLRDDGVSIHGSNVRWGFASHGCIGIPKDFAARVFDVTSKGDEVMIVSGKPKARTI